MVRAVYFAWGWFDFSRGLPGFNFKSTETCKKCFPCLLFFEMSY